MQIAIIAFVALETFYAFFYPSNSLSEPASLIIIKEDQTPDLTKRNSMEGCQGWPPSVLSIVDLTYQQWILGITSFGCMRNDRALTRHAPMTASQSLSLLSKLTLVNRARSHGLFPTQHLDGRVCVCVSHIYTHTHWLSSCALILKNVRSSVHSSSDQRERPSMKKGCEMNACSAHTRCVPSTVQWKHPSSFSFHEEMIELYRPFWNIEWIVCTLLRLNP